MKVKIIDAQFLRKKIEIFFVILCVIIAITLTFNFISFSDEDTDIEAVSQNEISKIVIIDPGHGGVDAGATGVSGVYEKDLNLEIAFTLGELLKEKGYTVVYTRTTDKLLYREEENIKGMRKFYDLKNRCAVAEGYEDAIFISIHMNSFGASKYSGLQVYYSNNNDKSRLLADKIQSSVRANLQPTNNRQIKNGKDIYILDNCKALSVLVECGFLSNPEECEKLSQKEYQKELCFSILCGIIDYNEAEVLEN